jgi:lysophospholipase L1-like esterase
MQKFNIVAFGDSFTWGWLLPDQDTEHTFTSKYAWPNLLANKFSCNANNAACLGSSNREIWHRIVNYKFDENDVAVILWSWVNRYAIIKGPTIDDIEQVKINTPIARRLDAALDNNNDFDRMYDSYTYIDHANRLLKERNVAAYNFQINALEHTPSWATATNMCPVRFVEVWSKFPYTSDQTHPNTEAHEETANIMFNFIKSRQDVDTVK